MANTLIHESRRLLLPFDTVVDALIELEIKHGRWPAGASLVEVSLHDSTDDGARSIVLSVRQSRQEGTSQRTYRLPIIAAAIVNYCLTMRVPMPRNSSKAIEILPEGIALHLENTLTLQRRHAEGPPVQVVPDSPAERSPLASAEGEPAPEGAAGETAEPQAQTPSAAELEGEGGAQTPPSVPQA